MKYTHEEMSDILPDYVCGGLAEEVRNKVRSHLDGCGECRADLRLLIGMMCIEDDDPGELFRHSLPRKVREEIRLERNGRSFRGMLFPLSAAVAAAAMIVVALIFTLRPDPHRDAETVYSYHDPLSYSIPDVKGLKEEDIPLFTEEIAREDVYRPAGEISGFGYCRDLASLDGKELERLAEALKEHGKTGG